MTQETLAADKALEQLTQAIEALGKDEEGRTNVPGELAQKLMILAIRSYVDAYRQVEEPENRPLPVAVDAGLTATEAAIVADGLLEAADMDVFELQMWRSMGRR